MLLGDCYGQPCSPNVSFVLDVFDMHLTCLSKDATVFVCAWCLGNAPAVRSFDVVKKLCNDAMLCCRIRTTFKETRIGVELKSCQARCLTNGCRKQTVAPENAPLGSSFWVPLKHKTGQ